MRYFRFILFLSTVFIISFFSSGCSILPPSLTVECVPAGAGTATWPQGSYDKGVQLNVVASPAQGYRFDHWEGGAAGTSPTIQVTMDGRKKLVAHFVKTYSLTVSVSPSKGGTVSGTGTYDEGNPATLIANPAQYYEFAGWAGDASGVSNQTTIIMNSDKHVTAAFAIKRYMLQIQTNTQSGGSAEPSSGIYEALTQVNITATPATGYRFAGWTGSEINSSNPLTVTMNTDKSITANFIKQYKLTVSADPDSGKVNSDGGIYDEGTSIELIATSVFPYAFMNWSGADNNTINPTTITMDADKDVLVSFSELSPMTSEPVSVRKTMYGYAITMATFTMDKGQWVKGVIRGAEAEIGVYIADSNNNVLWRNDRLSTANFTFQAPRDDDYSFVVYKIYSLGTTDCILTYTIYS